VLHAFAGEVTRLWLVNVRFAPLATKMVGRGEGSVVPKPTSHVWFKAKEAAN
jgi:hypothetical protein